jgi:hypothetical protein
LGELLRMAELQLAIQQRLVAPPELGHVRLDLDDPAFAYTPAIGSQPAPIGQSNFLWA